MRMLQSWNLGNMDYPFQRHYSQVHADPKWYHPFGSYLWIAVVSILLYGCTAWMLTKQLEKKLDSNYTRMLRAILNKSWLQHTTRHQLYGHLPPTRHAGTSSKVMYSYGPPYMAEQKQDDQLEHTFSSYVRIRDVALKTCQRRWTIGRSGKRGSWISVLAARHDDDDDDG